MAGWSPGYHKVTLHNRAHVGGLLEGGAEVASELEQKERKGGQEGLAFYKGDTAHAHRERTLISGYGVTFWLLLLSPARPLRAASIHA